MISPADFATGGKAWIEAIGSVLTCAIGQAGTIGLAGIALIQNLRLKAEMKDRLDRQSQRIDNVLLNSQPAATPAPTAPPQETKP